MKQPVKRVEQAIRDSGGSSVGLSCHPRSEPVYHLEEHIPERLTLTRRPSRDDREEELPQLRTEDGRTLALVERAPDAVEWS